MDQRCLYQKRRWRELYDRWRHALLPKLMPDVLLLADNVLSHPAEIAGYVQALETLPDFERVVVPVGKGLSVAYRRC